MPLCGIKDFVIASAKCSDAQRQKVDPDALREFLLALKAPEVDPDISTFAFATFLLTRVLVVKIIAKQGLQREKVVGVGR